MKVMNREFEVEEGDYNSRVIRHEPNGYRHEVCSLQTKRAQKGAALLDERMPDWPRQINGGKFNIYSLKACILGQLFGDYDVGTDNLAVLDTDAEIRHGFLPANSSEASRLETAWLAEIKQRLWAG